VTDIPAVCHAIGDRLIALSSALARQSYGGKSPWLKGASQG
jgi:hypothetical protein